MARVNRFFALAVAVLATFGFCVAAFGQENPLLKAKAAYDVGVARVGKGDYEGAIRDFTKAIESDPKNPVYYAARGNARTTSGELEDAIADFSTAIELDPARRVPYINRGVAKVDKGDLDGAIADYAKALTLDPKNVTAYRNRGCARQQKGDYEGARNDFQQAIQLATDEGAYQRFYLYLLGQKQTPRSQPAELKSAVGRWKDGWKKTVGLFLAGEIDETALLERAVQGSDKAVREQKCEGYYYAGEIKLIRGETAAAKELLERSVATQLHTFPEFQFASAELNNIVQSEKGR
jgi:lipoprotein NlpI